MIKILDERPDNLFKEVEGCGFTYLAYYQSDELICNLALNMVTDIRGEIHMHVHKWSPSIAKKMIAEWPFVVQWFKDRGATQILAVNFDSGETKTWGKFIRLFGFGEPMKLKASILEI